MTKNNVVIRYLSNKKRELWNFESGISVIPEQCVTVLHTLFIDRRKRRLERGVGRHNYLLIDSYLSFSRVQD